MIQVCTFNEECVRCLAKGDHRTYGRCHTAIAYRHGPVVVTYPHKGRPVSRRHRFDNLILIPVIVPFVIIFVVVKSALSALGVVQVVTHAAAASGLTIAVIGAVVNPLVLLLLPMLAAFCYITTLISCRRPECRWKLFLSDQPYHTCYYKWEGPDGCGCEVVHGLKQDCSVATTTCTSCAQTTETRGCIPYCEGCNRNQADGDFAQHGCATMSQAHDVVQRI